MGALWTRGDVGVMMTPLSGRWRAVLDLAPVFACDTGCYARPERYSDAAYLDWLAGLRPYRARCLFATGPDVLGDWAATWARSAPLLPRIRELGFRAAVVAQDGARELPPADAWDVLFVGGTTGWKLSEAAYGLVRAARALGRPVHLGRVNSWRRLRAAKVSGYTSADGTCLARNPPQYCLEIQGWLDRLRTQPPLPLGWGGAP
jgi:hypothetical protein